MEKWDLYDRKKVKTGKVLERSESVPKGYYHLVVHACIFNKKHQMLIQQRTDSKAMWGGYWDTSVNGCARAGEDGTTAIKRETFEELGIDYDFSKLAPRLVLNYEDAFGEMYILNLDIDESKLKLQKEEVQQVKWASEEEVLELINSKKFIPYKKTYISFLFDMSKSKKYDIVNFRKK